MSEVRDACMCIRLKASRYVGMYACMDIPTILTPAPGASPSWYPNPGVHDDRTGPWTGTITTARRTTSTTLVIQCKCSVQMAPGR